MEFIGEGDLKYCTKNKAQLGSQAELSDKYIDLNEIISHQLETLRETIHAIRL